MKPEAIQNERDRIGSTKRNRHRNRLVAEEGQNSGDHLHFRHPTVSSSGSAVAESVVGSPDRNSESSDDSIVAASMATPVPMAETRALIELLMSVERSFVLAPPGAMETASDATSRQLTHWSNKLSPLVDLPAHDKVGRSFSCN